MTMPIRSIERALEVIRLMNQHEASRLHDLHRLTGLPSPTLYRILATLRRIGFVRAEGGGSYRLTEKVRELGSGYTARSRLLDIATPVALRVTRKIRWPLAIGTLDGDAIKVRYSTMPYSPLAVQATTLGHRLGLLDSAMGLAYLSFCAEAERSVLLDLLRTSATAGAPIDMQQVNALLNITRRRGYGLRLPQGRGASATVAVPIRVDGDVRGVLSITMFGRSMTRATLDKYLPVLRQTAIDIGFACAESSLTV